MWCVICNNYENLLDVQTNFENYNPIKKESIRNIMLEIV